MNEDIRFTQEELRITLSVLNRLKEQDTEVDINLYTTDYVVDMMIDYFEFCEFELTAPTSPDEDYQRAMGVIK